MLILMIDDNRFYVSVLKEMLSKAGFNRLEDSDSVQEGVPTQFDGESPDVVIIDENQCFKNDVDVLKYYQKSSPGFTAIILTSTDSGPQEQGLPQKGSPIYMPKDSVTADNLPKILYNLYSEKINSIRKSPASRA